jgi:hypothetical protein
MPIPLDDITRKKLILVRQLYQRAILQAETMHSYVDRIMAVIGLDLSNETALKAVVGAVAPNKSIKNDFQHIVTQADDELILAALPPVPDKIKIQHVRTLRNDAQHKAKYPNEHDVSDCRTYTRDFLKQIILDVWGEDFETLSLVDTIQNPKVKGYLQAAEIELRNGNYVQAAFEAISGYNWTISQTKASIMGRLPYDARAFLVTDGSERQKASEQIFQIFKHMRDTIMRSVVGISFSSYRRYRQITESIGHVTFFQDGGRSMGGKGYSPNVKEAEYVVEFATNAVLQIESLVGDIDKPFEL